MTGPEDALRGLGFGAAAAEYVSGRPDYPAQAVAWLLRDAEEVADVGAGTGKLTAAIVRARCDVVAVEPDAAMIDALVREVPQARALRGTAEALPLADASVDAVLFGQAWHWVDVPAASTEAARVLRPGGALGLIWNVRDDSVDWVEQLGTIMKGSVAEETIRTDAVRVGPPFGALERREWPWVRPMRLDQLVAMAASRSSVIALEQEAREAVLRDVRALIEAHPDTAGRDLVPMPYRTVAFRAPLG